LEYIPSSIEKKWQEYWKETKYSEPSEDKSREKKYILSMFPYPSGKIHMGHVRNYSISDAIARYNRQLGKNVLHPIGWDSFGMPAENAAIKHKVHPKKWTYENIEYMRKELDSLGLSFAKSREFATSDEIYTKFEQEFFIDMYKDGMLYQKNSIVNWCESCHTVLANEQVVDGCCWRCDNEIKQKDMPGYYLKITDYAQELLDDLESLKDKWPSQVITMQSNWIGRSEGLEFDFELSTESKKKLGDKFDKFSVFTTRADTIMGVSFSSLSPEHDIVKYILDNNLLDKKSSNAIKAIKKLTERERAQSEKEGIDLGITVLHPITKEQIPVWVANFVLSGYGSGAVMAVPAHDERDKEFALKYNLEIKEVIKNDLLINSGKYNGLKSKKAIKSIIYDFESAGIGKKVINFKLRDWGISRQRYWGAPIPMVHCSKCGIVSEKKDNLPITLPQNIEITGEGNPLESCNEFVKCTCPKCGANARREIDTMDTFFQSSWYFLRYINPESKKLNQAFNTEDVKYWMSVDNYVGGIEHAILHLLYSRYFTKILRDLKYIDINEPFINLLTQGMVLKDGSKMSKSKGNTVDPDLIIHKYGADTARLFILFAAPPTKELEYNVSGVEGAFKFIKRFSERSSKVTKIDSMPIIDIQKLKAEDKEARIKVYESLIKAKEVYSSNFTFNTLIASVMEALNSLKNVTNQDIWNEAYYIFTSILEPIIPHICWEISLQKFNLKNFRDIAVLDEVFISDTILFIVQVNGKKRAEIEVDKSSSKDLIIDEAKKSIIKWLDNKEVVKEIVVPNKLVNIVVK